MGEKIKNTKFMSMFPSVLVTLWAGYIFFTSLDREPWRIICSGIGFAGLAAMTFFFFRRLNNQINNNQAAE
jgi:hypothetical protein